MNFADEDDSEIEGNEVVEVAVEGILSEEFLSFSKLLCLE